MKVTIELPDPVWKQLVGRAEAHGLTVADIVTHGIRQVMPRRTPQGEDILTLSRAGVTDSQIAEGFGIPRALVSKVRRGAGIDNPRAPRAGGKESA